MATSIRLVALLAVVVGLASGVAEDHEISKTPLLKKLDPYEGCTGDNCNCPYPPSSNQHVKRGCSWPELLSTLNTFPLATRCGCHHMNAGTSAEFATDYAKHGNDLDGPYPGTAWPKVDSPADCCAYCENKWGAHVLAYTWVRPNNEQPELSNKCICKGDQQPHLAAAFTTKNRISAFMTRDCTHPTTSA